MKELRGTWLLALSVAPQILWGTRLPLPVLVPCMMVLIIWLWMNRHHRGLALAAAGVTLNLIPIALNAGMPVSAAAIERAGIEETIDRADQRHTLAGPGTRLSWLGDVIPLPGRVVSIGDLTMIVGLASLISSTVRSSMGWRRTRPERVLPSPVDFQSQANPDVGQVPLN